MQFVQSTIRSIDPAGRTVDTDAGRFEADVLVIALGADLDPGATPGLLEAGDDFYTPAGAFAARDVLDSFDGGRVVGDRLDPQRRVAVLADGDELAFDLFLGVPRHQVPAVVAESGMCVDGWVRVDVADRLIARQRDTTTTSTYDGTGVRYIEFGDQSVARVEVTFRRGEQPIGSFDDPSTRLLADKASFGSTRARRWFGTEWVSY